MWEPDICPLRVQSLVDYKFSLLSLQWYYTSITTPHITSKKAILQRLDQAYNKENSLFWINYPYVRDM